MLINTALPNPISVVRKRSTQQININGLANCWFHRQRLEEQYIQKCWQSIMFITFLSPVTRGHGTQTLYRRRATQRDRAKVCQCSVRKTFVCKPFLPGQAQDAKSVLQVETSGRSGNCCEIWGSLGCYGFVLRWLKIWWKRGRLVEDILGGTICIVFKYFLSLPLLWVHMFSNTPGNDRFRVRFHCVARRISLAIRGIFLTQTIFTKKLLFPHGPHYNVWMCWLRCLIKKNRVRSKTLSHIFAHWILKLSSEGKSVTCWRGYGFCYMNMFSKGGSHGWVICQKKSNLTTIINKI